MAFDWNNYFILAGELAANKNDEAKMRSAISRGYYCAYNLAKKFLKANGNLVVANDHEDMWNQFADFPDDKSKIQSWGDRTRRSRNKADYDIRMPNVSDELQQAMMNVNWIIIELKK